MKADSPVRSPKDLAGRTVAANTLKNITETSVKASVKKAGGDAAPGLTVAMYFTSQHLLAADPDWWRASPRR